MSGADLLMAALLIPAGAVPLILMAGRHPNLREAVTLTAAGALMAVALGLYYEIQQGRLPTVVIAEPLEGLPLALHAEPLGILFALVSGFLWPVTAIYSIGYMRGHHESHQTRFYAWFALALASVMGVALAANLFTLFVFYELLTLSTYPLVTHAGNRQALMGGRVYLGILLSTSMVFLLLALVWTWQLAGTLDFRQGGILTDTAPRGTLLALFALFLFGVGKAAIMPFHRWLPAAMVAPTPVSALLHAVAVVKAGVFTVLKVSVYIFGIDLLSEAHLTDGLMYLAGLTILLASIVAMRQDNLKLRLAYSTVSQLSYVLLGAMLANAAGIIGGAMHIATHAFGKITLFFCAGAILVATHKTQISDMRGLGRSMPVTMAAFLIGSLSLIGLPPMGGTWSKTYLALGTLDAGHGVLLAVLMVSSLLNIAYLIPIPARAFFLQNPHDGPQELREAPIACLVAITITSLGCVALFLFPDPLYDLAGMLIRG